MRLKTLIACLFAAASMVRAEIIQPEFSGSCIPPGWLPRLELARPELGVALSGGGLRGLAHIGALKALEKNGIKIDRLAGVSMGGLVGALYASGYSPDEIERKVRKIDWGDIFLDKPSRRSLFLTRKRTHGRHILQIRFKNWKPYFPPAITSGQKLSTLIDDLLMNAPYRPEPDFDHLKIPFRTLATDLNTGERVIFDRGDLSEALRATSSIPLVFAPMKVNGKTLVDGGILENIPALTVREMGADKVIAVNASSPLQTNVDEPWEIVDQITTIMMDNSTQLSLNSADIILTPLPDSVGSFDFSLIDSLPKWGEICTEERISDIKKLMEPPPSSDSARFTPASVKYVSIGWLEIDSTDKIYPGVSISRSELRSHLAGLYEKYELMDIRAEISGDTITITYTRAPSYRRIVVKGNRLIPDSTIIKAIKSPPWAPLIHSRGVADREWIIRLYRKQGYSFASIKESRLQGDTLFITIDEGRISRLTVQGGSRSALKDLGLHEGEVFNWNTARKGINRLYSSDLYETVRLSVDETGNGREVKLLLDRRPFPLIRLGERYDLERSWSVFAEFITAGLLGSGTGLTVFASPGSKDTRVGMGIGSDRLFRTYISFNAGVFHQKNRYRLYDKEHHQLSEYEYERNYGIFRFGQLISRWGLLSAAFKLDNTISSHPAESDRKEKSASFIFGWEVDTYDRYPFPRSGENLKITFQTTSEIVPAEEIETTALDYSKIFGDFQRWIPLARRYTLYLRLRGGYAERSAPTYEKFSLGGLNDFGGLHVREVLGNQLLAGSVGLRFDLLSRFLAEAFLTMRYDFGQIVDGADVLELKRSFFRQGTNLSFGLNTLLGPVEIAYGWAVSYKDIPQNHLVYFSVGHEF